MRLSLSSTNSIFRSENPSKTTQKDLSHPSLLSLSRFDSLSSLFLSLVLVNLDLIFDEMVFSLELDCVDCVEFSDVLVLKWFFYFLFLISDFIFFLFILKFIKKKKPINSKT